MKYIKILFIPVLLLFSTSFVDAAVINTGINCTLSEAILSAQTDTSYGLCVSGSGSDIINVNQDEVIQTIPLGNYPDGENAFKTITTQITINGNNKVISFQNNSNIAGRLFNVINGNLEINNLNFVNLVGGAPIIDNGGFMYVDNSSVRLNNVKIDSFLANISGGAIFSQNSIIKIAKSNLIYNVSSGNDYLSGGGAIYFEGGELHIDSSLFDHNHSVYQGGAVFSNGDYNNISINKTTFYFNSSDYGSALNLGLGSVNKSVTINNSTFEKNYSNIGSAVAWRGWDGSISISGTTFYDNKGFSDGASFENSDGSGKVKIINSTFSMNESFGIGSAILNKGEEPEFIVAYNTFVDNNSNAFGGTFSSISGLPWGPSYLENNIFYGNIGGDCSLQSDLNFTMTNNLSDDGTCGTISATGVDINIANNGGGIKTHKLLNGSNAIDSAITNPQIVKVSCPAQDQRAAVRGFDGNNDGISACDIGAFEFNKRNLTNAVGLTSLFSKESKEVAKEVKR